MTGIDLRVSDEAVPKEIRDGGARVLDEHRRLVGGELLEEKPFSLLAYRGQELIGGLIGRIFWYWLYAESVWVEERFRGQDVGTTIMEAAEDRARERKLNGIYLWTQSWGAAGFYEKLGYTQFVEFKNCPPGHSRLGFFKYLQ
jgi:GNAT superfamily N-acetyltransferase